MYNKKYENSRPIIRVEYSILLETHPCNYRETKIAIIVPDYNYNNYKALNYIEQVEILLKMVKEEMKNIIRPEDKIEIKNYQIISNCNNIYID